MGTVIALRPQAQVGRTRTARPGLATMRAEVLEAIAGGQRLAAIAPLLCRWIERIAPRALCGLVVADPGGASRAFAGPGLPHAVLSALHEAPVQALDLSCDGATAQAAGLRACWSNPLPGGDGRPAGAIVLYFRSPRGPNRIEALAVAEGLRLAGLALEREAVLLGLERANDRVAVALANVQQGVCFFDGQQRLIMANGRYAEIYGLSQDAVQPGVTLQQIVGLRMEAGSGPNMSRDDYLHWRNTVQVQKQASDSVVRLANGRVVSVHHRPMPDGGWVATHEDITAREHAQARIVHLATHDPLTGLPNRNLFRERLETALTDRVPAETCAVIYLDLDRFKQVNDTWGHPVGDRLLIAVARRLQACLRGGDTVTRLGGDEFAILLPRMSQHAQAGTLAARITSSIARTYDLEGQAVTIAATLGVAAAPGDGSTADQLLRRADLALYSAKADRRGTCRTFDPSMEAAPAVMPRTG